MGDDRIILDKTVARALSGKGAHIETKTVFAALDWTLAGVRHERAPHPVYQLLNHMLYWQERVVKWLHGRGLRFRSTRLVAQAADFCSLRFPEGKASLLSQWFVT